LVEPLAIDESPKDHYKRNDVCVHINGCISRLHDDNLNSSFKLTRSSYASPESFATSQWYYSFKKDLEQCSALIFVGYSLYDIDVEKVLFSSPDFKEKTYFIVSESAPHKELFALSKYGKVLKVGIDGFAEMIKSVEPKSGDSSDAVWFDSFDLYEITENEERMTDADILRFILLGDILDNRIDDAMSGSQRKPYLIVRECVDEITARVLNKENIALIGEFGCGKSIATKELASSLTMYGKKVYVLSDNDGNHLRDIEKINKMNEESVLVLDDYTHSMDTVKYLCHLNSDNISCIFIDRTHEHEKHKAVFIENRYEVIEYNLDLLSDSEIYQLVEVISNLGYWADLAHFSTIQKANVIAMKYNRRIAIALLQIFKSPIIKEKIKNLLDPLFKDDQFKRTVFSISLIEVLNFPLKLSLISEIACNDEIYKISLKNDSAFQQLYGRNVYGQIKSKSSILSLSILLNHFEPSYIIDSLLDLVEKLEKKRNASILEGEFFKNLLRFRSVEQILPDKNKKK